MPAPLRVEPRWTDLDPAGHVNNSVFLVYAEEARARFLKAALPAAWGWIVVVHSSIDYHHPIVETDAVDVASSVDRVGTTSLSTLNVLSTASHRCATVRTVQVVLREDRTAGRPWSDGERETLLGLRSTPQDHFPVQPVQTNPPS